MDHVQLCVNDATGEISRPSRMDFPDNFSACRTICVQNDRCSQGGVKMPMYGVECDVNGLDLFK